MWLPAAYEQAGGVELMRSKHRGLSLAAPLLAIVSLATLAGLAAAPGGPSIRIIRPRAGEVLSGPTIIEAEVRELPAASVEFFVDGRSVGTARTPPYRVEFDFGDSLGSRRIRAVAIDDAGKPLMSANIVTRSFKVDQLASVDLVNLYVTVRDKSERLVQGLGPADFRVLEDGRQQLISHFSGERLKLAVALTLDCSLSMRGDRIEEARASAMRFIDRLEPADRAMVVCFNREARVVQELSSDTVALKKAVMSCEPVGGTALYDAVYAAADLLAPIEGRKVMVLLSDGRDESESGLEPGSLHLLEEALDRALRSEVILYAVGVGNNLDEEMDFFGRRSLSSILDEMASKTGGRAIFLKRASRLGDAFEEIGEELRRQYSLAFVSDNPSRDGAWREIRISLGQPGLKAFTRKGYFAPRAARAAG